MKKVVAYKIINKPGAAGVIFVWVEGTSTGYPVRFQDTTDDNRMNHFIAAIAMLQNDNVAFDPSSNTFEVRHRIQNLQNDDTLEDFEEFA